MMRIAATSRTTILTNHVMGAGFPCEPRLPASNVAGHRVVTEL
jgi:hypothetical protein